MFQRTFLVSALLLAGCGGTSDILQVQILPSEYIAGAVKSPLATPVVDEVVRLNPRNVHISMCRSTPNAKVMQFNLELQARHDAKITGGFYENCPET
ncbi:hypothetical protein HNP48_001493 [Acidovorax soli]|uniref:Lipoprotein n=1 Tax=Acidovorax soli TaxID=592050 RepID=A0A7X0PC13_9BURK|nr:hypothetical protein [Acidovorax soli]MBB6558829.1 hypothetical protein [Acidovorax soli]